MATRSRLSLHDAAFLQAASLVVPPVAGYKMWLAPESAIYSDTAGTTLATSGNEVRYWQDLSGNGNHAVGFDVSSTNGPYWSSGSTVNGKRVLIFGDAGAYTHGVGQANRTALITSGNVALSAGCTLFWISSFLTPVTGIAEIFGGILGYKNFELLVRQNNATKQFATYNNASGVGIIDSGTPGNASYQRYMWRFNDTANTQKLMRAGSQVASGADTGATPSAGRVAVGFRQDDTVSSHFCGGVCEFLFYDNPLSDSDVTLVDAYLSAKYGV